MHFGVDFNATFYYVRTVLYHSVDVLLRRNDKPACPLCEILLSLEVRSAWESAIHLSNNNIGVGSQQPIEINEGS